MRRILFIILTIFVISLPVLAYELEVKIPGSGLSGNVDLVRYLNGIYKFAFAIIGLAAFGSLVFAGIMYLLAAGNIGEIGEAKSRIWSTLGGVLLALSIFLIFQTINPSLLNTKMPFVSPAVKCGTTDSAGKSIKGYCAELGKTCVDKYASTGGSVGPSYECKAPNSHTTDIKYSCTDSFTPTAHGELTENQVSCGVESFSETWNWNETKNCYIDSESKCY